MLILRSSLSLLEELDDGGEQSPRRRSSSRRSDRTANDGDRRGSKALLTFCKAVTIPHQVKASCDTSGCQPTVPEANRSKGFRIQMSRNHWPPRPTSDACPAAAQHTAGHCARRRPLSA